MKQVIQYHDFFLEKCLRECLLLLPELLKVGFVFLLHHQIICYSAFCLLYCDLVTLFFIQYATSKVLGFQSSCIEVEAADELWNVPPKCNDVYVTYLFFFAILTCQL